MIRTPSRTSSRSPSGRLSTALIDRSKERRAGHPAHRPAPSAAMSARQAGSACHLRTLGDAVSAAAIPLDDDFPQCSDSWYLDVELSAATDECMMAC